MTLALILGAIAGLYILSLLFRLAVMALPAYAALTVGLLLLEQGYRYPVVILTSFAAAGATLFAGRVMIASVRSPLLRGIVGLMFAAPAAFAGYQAAHAFAGLADINNSLLCAISLLAGLSTAVSAWRGVTRTNEAMHLAQPC